MTGSVPGIDENRPAEGGDSDRLTLVFVGGGPRTTGLLERLSANVSELSPDAPLTIHIVDPFPPGAGRIWRTSQSSLLWMNSTAADTTIFTDDSVTCAGPIRPGPSLAQWLDIEGVEVLRSLGLGHHIGRFGADDFVPREIQGAYLGWVFDRVVGSFPEQVRITVHADSAVAVRDVPGSSVSADRQVVELADGTILVADVVVLAQGYLDRELDAAQRELAAKAAQHSLTYVPPNYTADLDLTPVPAGSPVLVRGLGLAFIDLMVLLTEGRGGRYTENDDGSLQYHRSGREPVLVAGSRRGVPYHAKLGYAIADATPVTPRYFTQQALLALPDAQLDFRTVLWPLIAKELTAAHYRRLFQAHTERVSVDWEAFQAALDPADVLSPEFAEFVVRVVPDPADRFVLAEIDRPLQGLAAADRASLSAAVRDHVVADLARRSDPSFSADRAVFDALLGVYAVLSFAVTEGRVSPVDRIRSVERTFHGLFSFLASGPPPRRLRELLALIDAGVVIPAGPDWEVTVQDGEFVGTTSALSEEVRSGTLIDAWIPHPDIAATTDPVIGSLLAAGELATEEMLDAEGYPLEGGQLLADSASRAIRADGSVHRRRLLLGPSVSGSAGSSGFSRPGFNAPGFRQNDAVARGILLEIGTTGRTLLRDGATVTTAAPPTAVPHPGAAPSSLSPTAPLDPAPRQHPSPPFVRRSA